MVPDTLSRSFEVKGNVSELEVKPSVYLESMAFDEEEYSKFGEDLKSTEG